MYINCVRLTNIKSIIDMEMRFEGDTPKAGWHVLIGDNGSGKSTVVRAITLALLGYKDAIATRENWAEWLNKSADSGAIILTVSGSSEDKNTGHVNEVNPLVENKVVLNRNNAGNGFQGRVDITFDPDKSKPTPYEYNWGDGRGWFSAAFGPFRRFSGGNAEKQNIYLSNPKLGAHLSILGEDVALSEAIPFIIQLYVKKLEGKTEGAYLDSLIRFINQGALLPHDTTINAVDSDGVYFKDGNKQVITALNMSDGFRSVLSLTFELIRQLVRVYGEEEVFKNHNTGKIPIELPGVVLIDEIDAHLHPTWQVRIGEWFTKYFPNIQFIVTSHSPLICHAAQKGSVWRMAAPGSNQISGQVTGNELKRILYGNILDAYGTELFGITTTLSEDGQHKQQRLAELNVRAFKGKLNEKEREELHKLQEELPSAV